MKDQIVSLFEFMMARPIRYCTVVVLTSLLGAAAICAVEVGLEELAAGHLKRVQAAQSVDSPGQVIADRLANDEQDKPQIVGRRVMPEIA